MSTPRSAPGVSYLVWELTLRCDLACEHCGSRAGRPREKELSTEEALAVVAQLGPLGVREVTLIGGEAYLHPGFLEVLRALRDAGIHPTLGTGGRAIHAERARAMADAGLAAVGVSLDGLRASHDQLRGLEGSWDAALGSLRNLREAGVQVGANTQLNRVSAPDLEALFELLLAEGARGWQLQLTVPMGRAAERPEWLLQPFELLELFPRLAVLAERARREDFVFQPSNNVGYFGPLASSLGRSAEEPRLFFGCDAGRRGLGLEADGSLKGCPSLPSEPYRAGSVRESSLRALLEHSPQLRFTQDNREEELWGYCAECYYGAVCQGGCSWMAHSLFGRRGNNPYCHHRALELAAQGLRERVLPLEAPPGAPFDLGRWELRLETLDGNAVSSQPAARTRRRLPLV